MTDTTAGEGVIERLNAVANLIERPPLDDVVLERSVAVKLAEDIRTVIAACGAWAEVSEKARRYARHYPEASDGRNTFVMFAEWADSKALAAQPSAGAQGEAVAWRVRTTDKHFGSFIVTDQKTYQNGRDGWIRNGWIIDPLGVIATPALPDTAPVPVTIFCPKCNLPHIDEGEWASERHHKTHKCQGCGHEWRPFSFATVGIPHPKPDTGVAFSASDRACYEYPGVEQAALRDAFVAGAEAYAQPDTGGWIVGNAVDDYWRTWVNGNPDWTSDRDLATRYHRREDAELVHREDEDAWRVAPYGKPDPGDVAALREALEPQILLRLRTASDCPGVNDTVVVFGPDLRALLRTLRDPGSIDYVILDIAAERQRQQSVEGWSLRHDDQHDEGQMARAAATYAMAAALPDVERSVMDTFGDRSATPHPVWQHWPWNFAWWKPRSRRRDLVRAGALIVAEIERLDRLAALSKPNAPGREG